MEFAPFGDLAAVEKLLAEREVAAVILEPIQSIAGVTMAEAEYYQGLRAMCDRNGSLLIFDEIQTGLGRTGTLWAGEHWGVVPDIITIAKGIASGGRWALPSSPLASLRRSNLDEHGSTSGEPIAAPPPPPLGRHPGRRHDRPRRRDGRTDEARLSLCRTSWRWRPRSAAGLAPGRGRKDVQAAALKGESSGHISDPNVLRVMHPMVVTQEDVEHLASGWLMCSADSDTVPDRR